MCGLKCLKSALEGISNTTYGTKLRTNEARRQKGVQDTHKTRSAWLNCVPVRSKSVLSPKIAAFEMFTLPTAKLGAALSLSQRDKV